MRHLLSSEMKLQRGSEKMTSYYINLLLFLPLSPSLLFSHLLFPSLPCVVFFISHLGIKTRLCFRGNDFLIKDS